MRRNETAESGYSITFHEKKLVVSKLELSFQSLPVLQGGRKQIQSGEPILEIFKNNHGQLLAKKI